MERIAYFASFRNLIVLMVGLGIATTDSLLAQQTQPATPTPATKSAAPALKPEEVDALLAPVALYPDQLLAQIFLCSASPFQIGKLAEWLAANQNLKGSALQEAAQAEGFDPSYVALALFPQIVQMMAEKPDWTKQLGDAFSRDRTAVFDSVQRLRNQAHQVGNLKTTSQQEVRTQTTQNGQQVIVIEPANPQVVYVPQYNPQVVYTQAPAPTTIVIQEDDDDDELAAGLIGFTAGIAIGAAVNNNYYWGPYGWHGGGGYMYADAWDDWADHREDAREDWMDHREDMAEDRSERQGTRQEDRTQRQETRQGERTERQATREGDRSQRQDTRQGDRTERQSTRQQGASTSDRAGSGTSAATRQQGASPAQRAGSGTSAATRQQGAARDTARVGSGRSSYESRGYGGGSSSRSVDRSGSSSGAFSGYSSGRSTRSSSSRGQSSRSSGGRGGGGRGGGGRGGGRRR